MAELIAHVGTPLETYIRFAKEAPCDSFLSEYIKKMESALVARAMVKDGLMQAGDSVRVKFVLDMKASPNELIRRIDIYTTCKTPEGKLVPNSFLDEFVLDIEIDDNN